MKFITLLFLFGVLTFKSDAQEVYHLPNDPVLIPQVNEVNWLRKTTQIAANNEYERSYNNLESFKDYFFQYESALSYIGKNETLSNLVFEWVRPYLIYKINTLATIDKIKIFQSLENMITYLKNFNFLLEQKYLSANQFLFAYKDPNDFFDAAWQQPYPTAISSSGRETDAFLFRRIRDGVSRIQMLTFLNDILGFVNVDFDKHLVINDDNGNPLYDFNWHRTHFDGIYKEYEISTIYGQSRSTLIVSGQYDHGKKVGIWKQFGVADNKPWIESETEYVNDKPIKLKEYAKQNYDRNSSDQSSPITQESLNEIKNHYQLIYILDIPARTLEVTVYQGNKIIKTINSIHDNIDFWDFQETGSRIISMLSTPNFEIAINKKIELKDKPVVARNQQTRNFVIYDELKRSGKDHALLIATTDYDSHYSFQKLKNPIRDAEAIADDLKDIYGFDCEILKNPSKQELLQCLEKYKKRKFENDEQLFIFISGHGSYQEGDKDGFLVPKDGKDPFVDFNHESWISYYELLQNLSAIESNHILLMVDACHSGSLQLAAAKLKNQDDQELNVHDAIQSFRNRIRLKTRIFITSSAADRVTSDGINHSPFTSMFIKGLRSFGINGSHILTVSHIFDYVDQINPPPIKNEFKGNEPGSSFYFIMK